MMEDLQPVYPKENPEYRKRVLGGLYRKIDGTKWENTVEQQPSTKGRKPAPAQPRPEAKPRTKSEEKVAKYDWFDKWTKK